MSEETLVPQDAPAEGAPQATVTTPSDASEKVVEAPKKEKPKKAKAKYYIPVKVGDKLTGKVKTIADFGAFIDLNMAIDGLVHISELARRRVQNVTDVIAEKQEVTVWVKSIDTQRGRIGLTMIKPIERRYSDVSEGDVLDGEVKRIEAYGVFVDIGLEREGLVHVSELAHDFVKAATDVVTVGETVQVKVLKIDPKKKQVNLSIKALQEAPVREASDTTPEPETEYEEVVVDEEPMTTAMAVALEKLGAVKRQPKRKKRVRRAKRVKRIDMDAVVARTLKVGADE